jgi:hypothetical protein
MYILEGECLMEKKTKPGEKGFSVLLLILGIFIIKESLGMYRNAPELQGYGTVPLCCGVLITVFALIIIVMNMFHKSEISGLPFKSQAVAIVKHLFSLDVLIMLLIIVAYCVLMAFGVPFVVASPVFLWCAMTYLERSNYLKNIIFTVIVMAFVLLVFKVGFGVVLP